MMLFLQLNKNEEHENISKWSIELAVGLERREKRLEF